MVNVLVLLLIGGYFAADLRLRRTDAVEFHARKPTPGLGQDWLLAAFERTPHGDRLARLRLLHLSPGGRPPLLIDLPPHAHAPGRIPGTLASAYARGGAGGLVAEVEQATGISVERYAGVNLDELGGAGAAGLARPDASALARLAFRAIPAVTLDEADHLHHLVRLGAALAGLNGPVLRVGVPIVRSAELPGAGEAVVWDAAKMRDLAVAVSLGRPLPAGLIVARPRP